MFQLLRSKLKKSISVHWMTYAIFAAFLILDGCFYLLSPYSGRISRLDCKPDSAHQSTCTVTIYGFRQIYRHSFTADQFIEALVIHNYTGDSADTTYGITLLTEAGRIGFIHPYQPSGVIRDKAQQINDLFVDAVPVPEMSLTFVGFNWSLYLRLLLLVAGLLIVLRRERKSREKPEAVPIGQPIFKHFAWQWFKNNLLVRMFFYLVILIIMLSGCTNQYSLQTDLVMGCYYVPQTRQGFFEWTWGYLLCFYPLLLLLLLRAMVQRRMLSKAGIHSSRWWVLAPLLATPLAIAISPQLYCEDCLTLKYMMAGIVKLDSPLLIGLVMYFLGLGLIQWLALRKNLTGSVAWVIMPLVNAMLVVPVLMGYHAYHISSWNQLDSFQRQISMRYLSFYLPALLMLLTILISEIIPALYISWSVTHRRTATPNNELGGSIDERT